MVTLATLSKATEQEVFDQVGKHLLAQMVRSEAKSTCLYRGPDGISCAAGCLMTDEEYNPSFEGNDWEMLVAADMVIGCHSTLIYKLQSIHDNYLPDKWEERLADLARANGLEFRKEQYGK